MSTSFSVEKAWFGLSLLMLSFGYGFASHAWGLFPKTQIERAWRQARAWSGVNESSGISTFIGTRKYDRKGVQTLRPGEVQSGLTLVSSSWKGTDGWKPELRLMNKEGRVVHRWRIDRTVFGGGLSQRRDPSKGGVQGSLLLSNGDVVVNLEYVGMARLDACGEVRWTLKEGNHHSISQTADGAFWVPGVGSSPQSQSERYPDGFPYLNGKKVWVDRLLKVSEQGEVLKDIDVLSILLESSLKRYIPKSLGGPWPSPQSVHTDLTHLNDIEPLEASMADEYPMFEAGDLLVSLRNLSLVFVVDPNTLDVRWHSSDPFIYHHDPDFIGEGWIGVFDNNSDFNGGQMLGGSRIVALQPHTDSMEVRFPKQRSMPFYTNVQGKWEQLQNGNMLLSEANAGRAVEVNANGETVWEWIRSPVDSARVPKVTKASRHDLSRKEISSWPCSSVDSADTSVQTQHSSN